MFYFIHCDRRSLQRLRTSVNTLLVQSSSSIEDKIKFVPARHDDLINLTQKVKTEEDFEEEDEMRFMNGDNPAVNFECGNQHGGHYACSGCDGRSSMCHDLNFMAQRKYRTLTKRQQLVLARRKGKEAKQLLNPFKVLKVNELQAEIEATGLWDSNNTRPELAQILNEELGRAKRIPALSFGDERVTVESLQSYEGLYFEALHCSMNHIKNILEEIPQHISDLDTLINRNTSCSTQQRENVRGWLSQDTKSPSTPSRTGSKAIQGNKWSNCWVLCQLHKSLQWNSHRKLLEKRSSYSKNKEEY